MKIFFKYFVCAFTFFGSFWLAMLRRDVQIKVRDGDDKDSVTTESMEKYDGPLESLPW